MSTSRDKQIERKRKKTEISKNESATAKNILVAVFATLLCLTLIGAVVFLVIKANKTIDNVDNSINNVKDNVNTVLSKANTKIDSLNQENGEGTLDKVDNVLDNVQHTLDSVNEVTDVLLGR